MDSDRLKRALSRFVRHTMSGVDYFAHYPAKVVAQAGDFSLDVIPDDPRLPGMQRVPLRLGVPGVTAKVSPGSRVLVFFEGGAPSAPAASIWQASTLTELVITASTKVTVNAPAVNLGAASAPVLRSGDAVTLGVGFASVTGGAVSGTGTLTISGPPSEVKA